MIFYTSIKNIIEKLLKRKFLIYFKKRCNILLPEEKEIKSFISGSKFFNKNFFFCEFKLYSFFLFYGIKKIRKSVRGIFKKTAPHTFFLKENSSFLKKDPTIAAILVGNLIKKYSFLKNISSKVDFILKLKLLEEYFNSLKIKICDRYLFSCVLKIYEDISMILFKEKKCNFSELDIITRDMLFFFLREESFLNNQNSGENIFFKIGDILEKSSLEIFNFWQFSKMYILSNKEHAIYKDKMVKSSNSLILSISKKCLNKGMDLLDIVQEGNLGLIKAINNFRHKRGFKFSTYSIWWIKQFINNALLEYSKVIKIPVYITEVANKINSAIKYMSTLLEIKISEIELSHYLEISIDKIQDSIILSKEPISLETSVGENEDSTLRDFIEDNLFISPEESALKENIKKIIGEILKMLTEKEAAILRMRFGISMGKNYTLEEIGQQFNVTRERIRQIEARVLKKLKINNKYKILTQLI